MLKGVHNFVHINLSIALLLALIVFVAGIETAADNQVAMKLYNTRAAMNTLDFWMLNTELFANAKKYN